MPVATTRCCGVLLHPTSLPSIWGIGDLGPNAYTFVDFLTETNQRLWQVLPLGPTGESHSPYSAYSSIAGNPWLISLEMLQKNGLLPKQIAPASKLGEGRANFARAEAAKRPLLRTAFDRFDRSRSLQEPWETFCHEQASWLDDYALFMSLKEAQPGQHWNEWDAELVQRETSALNQARDRLHEEVDFHRFCQFIFYRQWGLLSDYAHERGIRIVGDIPFYVAFDSVDVWANPENFALDPGSAEPLLMAGVPPDYFSATGQLWGNPVYDWKHLKNERFDWWVQRFKKLVQLVDVVRIDHFRGFQSFWQVPKGEKTAVNGEWAEGPGAALFETVERELGHLPIWAEDLGVITSDVEKLRDDFHFPGMNVLQFAFDEKGVENPYLTFNHRKNSVVYTGTHDNNTTRGWWTELKAAQKRQVSEYFDDLDEEHVHWALIRMALSSVADNVVVPLQDVLGLGGEGRMNIPGQEEGNWSWRYRPRALGAALRKQLQKLTQIYGRAARPTEPVGRGEGGDPAKKIAAAKQRKAN